MLGPGPASPSSCASWPPPPSLAVTAVAAAAAAAPSAASGASACTRPGARAATTVAAARLMRAPLRWVGPRERLRAGSSVRSPLEVSSSELPTQSRSLSSCSGLWRFFGILKRPWAQALMETRGKRAGGSWLCRAAV